MDDQKDLEAAEAEATEASEVDEVQGDANVPGPVEGDSDGGETPASPSEVSDQTGTPSDSDAESPTLEKGDEQPEPVEIKVGRKSSKVKVREEKAWNEMPEDEMVKVSVTLECELQKASFGNVAGDARAILLTHAKEQWRQRVPALSVNDVNFEGC